MDEDKNTSITPPPSNDVNTTDTTTPEVDTVAETTTEIDTVNTEAPVVSAAVQQSSTVAVPTPTTTPKDDKVAALNEIKKKVKIEDLGNGITRATTDTSKYIIEYDVNKCIGAASCAAIAPLTFFMNEENKAQFVADGEDFDDDETILAAAQSCPVFAIKIIDKATNEVIFPPEEME